MTAKKLLNDHIKATRSEPSSRFGMTQASPIHCKDGFVVSVQAGQSAYCTPKSNTGPWTEFECGFPSMPVPEWADYKCSDLLESDLESVFSCVPAEVIYETLLAHGGVVNWNEYKAWPPTPKRRSK